MNELCLKDIKFPPSLDNINKFIKQNSEIKINVFELTDNKKLHTIKVTINNYKGCNLLLYKNIMFYVEMFQFILVIQVQIHLILVYSVLILLEQKKN